jgi:gliding motility-associated-like protein
MPEEFEILEVIRNPFGGDILDTGKPNELLIKNMVIPLGVDSLTVKVRIGQNSSGSYRNQAILSGLPESLGSSTVSDDPLTVALNDPTVIKVIPLTVDLQSQNRLVCEGDTLTLSGSQLGAQYLWQDGTTDISIDVTTPGTYYVEARTLCEVVYDTVVVEFSPPLTVELGEDRALTLGESFSIEPWVTGVGPYEYKWSESDERATIFCATCPEATITPFFDTRYRVAVTDAAGCIETDYINVVVDRSVYIWIPNAFSPNGDGVNDYFYVLGKYSYNIESFEIYNRWGQRIWQNNDILVNSEFDGWTGSAFGEMMTPDVYVYRAVLKFIDGSKQYFTGDVTLIR